MSKTRKFLNELKLVLTSRLIRAGYFALIAFSLLTWLVPGPILIVFFTCFVMAGAVAIVINYAPKVWRILVADRIDAAALLVVGIASGWFWMVMLRFWGYGLRVFDQEWMRDSPLIAFFFMWSFGSAVLHLLAPDAVDGDIPDKNWMKVALAAGLAVFLASILILLNIGV